MLACKKGAEKGGGRQESDYEALAVPLPPLPSPRALRSAPENSTQHCIGPALDVTHPGCR